MPVRLPASLLRIARHVCVMTTSASASAGWRSSNRSRRATAQPPCDVTVDLGELPVEDHAEPVRRTQRKLDLTGTCPKSPSSFTVRLEQRRVRGPDAVGRRGTVKGNERFRPLLVMS